MNKKFALITTASLLLGFSSSARASSEIDWSVSFEQVKNTQQNKLIEQKQRNLTFETRLYELDFHLEYVFDEQGKLDNVLYYRSLSKDSKSCAQEYNAIKDRVITEQGTAKTQESVYNEAAKDSAEKLCSYAATGEYQLETAWQGKTADISLVLNTWKGTPYIGLYYRKSSH